MRWRSWSMKGWWTGGAAPERSWRCPGSTSTAWPASPSKWPAGVCRRCPGACAGGFAGRRRMLCGIMVEDQQEAAARLALPAHSRLVKLERLRQSGEQSFAVEICYFSAEEFAGLLSLPLERRSLFATLERDYGIELQYADEEVDATPASARIAELLGIHAGAPVLRIRQALFSTGGKATVYVIGFYRSDRHTLLIRRFRK